MEKAAIAKRLHLRDAKLSRILRLMTNARFVERTTQGKFALFALTRGGLLELERREKRETKNRDRLPAQVRETFARVGTAHPQHVVAEAVVPRDFFNLAIRGSVHTHDSAGLRNACRAIEDYLLHLHGPTPSAPGYLKAPTKNSYQGFSVTVVQAKKAEGHGFYAIEAVSNPKPASFPVGILHPYGEESEHVD